ncbi:MAG TPA: DUF5916 domain-containing protein [Gemmatimonadales bacterium]|nr:DUF5916 domain-containing protein [Gemmatimonadales bacterium]
MLITGLILGTILGAPGPRPKPDSTTTTHNAEVRAARTAARVTIDGALDDAAWQAATPVGDFLQRQPKEGAPASERTEVRVLYDDEAIYIGAHLYDDHPDSIIGRLGRRDADIQADKFTVFIDSYHDGRSGFYFGLNAAGTFYDGTLFNDEWDDNSWDGVWQGAVQRTADGWTAEFRIPYSQLRFRNAQDLVWGIDFRRDIARKNENDWLVYQPLDGSGFVSRFLPLRGLSGVRQATRLEVLPYVTTKATNAPYAAGDPFRAGSGSRLGAGADFKVGVGGGLTLDGTVNPDFGQVEVDPAVVNLSDVETVFQEKRPFFIEGANIFDAFGQGGSNNFWGFNWGGAEFFYSRRIGRAPQGSLPGNDYADVPTATTILGAAKLTGKLGTSWNVGALNAITGREDASYVSGGVRGTAEVEPFTYYGVYRAQKEIDGGRQGIGFIGTLVSRDLADSALRNELNSSALGGGIDGWTMLGHDRTWVLTGWFGGTDNRGSRADITALQQNSQHYFQRPDARSVRVDSTATHLAGYMTRITLNKQKGDVQFNTAFGAISPGFDPQDAGLLWRANVLNGHVMAGYRWSKPNAWRQQAQVNVAAFGSWDYDGNPVSKGVFGLVNLTLKNFWHVNLNGAYNPETVDNRLTRGGPLALGPSGGEAFLNVNTNPQRSVVWTLSAGGGSYSQNSQRYWNASLDATWQPLTTLSFELGPQYNWGRTGAQYVDTYADPTAAATYGSRYLFASLLQNELSANVRVNWIFSPKLSLQLYAQPLISSGQYSGYKALARPRSYAFDQYGQGAGSVTNYGDSVVVDADGAGPSPAVNIGQPDFNFTSLRGNAVLRWEYLPGSTLYLVWTQSRANAVSAGDFNVGPSWDRLVGTKPENIFALKVSYWWAPR